MPTRPGRWLLAVALAAGVAQASADSHTVGDFVWEDVNRNGLQDAGEPGIAGVTVRVLGEGCGFGWPSALTTDASGAYTVSLRGGPRCSLSFMPPNVPGHHYKPTASEAWPGSYSTWYRLKGNDSDIFTWWTGYVTPEFPVPLPDPIEYYDEGWNTSIDAGFVKWVDGGLAGTVWNDRNRNGQRDAGDPGLAGVTVDLMDSLVHVAQTVTTDAQGRFSFSGLMSDWNHMLRVQPLAGWAFTATDVGDDLSDNDFSGEDLIGGNRYGPGTLIFRLDSAEWRTSINAGLYDPQAAPVPEPARWALWLGGLAALGGLGRLRRRHGPAA